MQTYSGIQFWPLDPRIEEIEVFDIASALGKMCRFGGHARTFYSVAEHCVILSKVVSPKNALAALLHDAAEAYVGDMVRPLKKSMPAFIEAEQVIMDLIAKKFGLDTIYPDEVREADNRILLDERDQILGPRPVDWIQDIEGIKPLGVKINSLPYHMASLHWLTRLKELTA